MDLLFYALIMLTLGVWVCLFGALSRELHKKYSKFIAGFIFLFILRTYPNIPLHPEVFTSGNTSLENSFIRAAIYGVFFLVLRHWFEKPLQSLRMLFRTPGLGWLILITVLSSLWSETPFLTLRASIMSCFFLAWLAAHMARKFSWIEIDSIMRWSLIFVGLGSWIALGIGFGYQGGIAESNKALGNLMSLCIVLWLWKAFQAKSGFRFIAYLFSLFSFWILSSSYSVAATFSCFVLIGFVLILRFLQINKQRYSSAIIYSFVVISILGGAIIYGKYESILEAFDKSPNLTGRTTIWPILLTAIGQKPWLGYGFSGFWQSWRGAEDPSLPSNIAMHPIILTHAHNGFLEILLQIGIIGLCLYLFVLFKTMALSLNFYNKQYKPLVSGVPILVLTHLVLSNIGESSILGLIGPNYYWFLFVLTSTNLSAAEYKRQNENSSQNLDLKLPDGLAIFPDQKLRL